ncbi:MAG: two-component system response regulator QseB [Pseudomonadota bacterium]
MRLLLIEDDVPLGEALHSVLKAACYAVDWVQDGRAGDTALRTVDYDAVLLDLGLPGGEGLDWLAQWRGRGLKSPVLIHTARDGLEQRVAGLDGGADDYLVKPVAGAELLARLRAALRRSGGRSESIWRHGPLEFDPGLRVIRWQGQPVELTPKELGILEALMVRPGQILSRHQLAERVYGWGDDEPEGNAIEVHVHHLRRKLDPALIRTIRGLGYRMEWPESPQ